MTPQAPGVLGTLTHHAAALQYDRAKAHLSKQESGEDPAGSKAHHHRPLGQRHGCLGRRVIGQIWAGADVRMFGMALQQRCLQGRIAQLQVHDKDGVQGLLARIKAALEHLQRCNVTFFNAQLGCCQLLQMSDGLRRGGSARLGIGGRVSWAWLGGWQGFQRKLELGEADQGVQARGDRAKANGMSILGGQSFGTGQVQSSVFRWAENLRPTDSARRCRN
ncbi:MAG: hypothetical protein RL468_1997 [Pseudomonadota bacterium]